MLARAGELGADEKRNLSLAPSPADSALRRGAATGDAAGRIQRSVSPRDR